MFKFFRKYNKIILVVGGCVLMVAFLVPQAVTMFAPGGGSTTIGTVHGEEVDGMAVQSAQFELGLLSTMGFGAGLPTMQDGRPLDDGLSWIMLLADARTMGIWAGDAEVEAAIAGVGLNPSDIDRVAALRRVTPAFVRQAIRHWLMAEQYRELVSGIAYNNFGSGGMSPAMQRVMIANQFARETEPYRDNPQMMQFYAQLASMQMRGSHRLSRSLLTHFIRDNAATVSGRLLLIAADPANGSEPTDEALRTIFEAYKDVMPGTGTSDGMQGEKYPFGYRVPDRVRLGYVQLTREALQKSVSVGYADVLDYYRQNKATFKGDQAEAPDTPTAEARDVIEGQLISREVERLRSRVLAEVRSILAEDMRGLPEEDGYVKLPADFTPVAMDTLAERVKEKIGVELNVMDTPDWVTLSELSGLEGIGMSALGGVQGIFFPQYISLAKSLTPDPQEVPRGLRLQVGTPSEPMQDFEGNTYIFRLTAAEPAHAPASLDAVRDEVVRDTKTVAAYEALKQTADSWRERVVADGLDAAAGSQSAVIREVPPFQREAGLEGEVPEVDGVGRSKAFVLSAFALVDELPLDVDVTTLPMDQRVAVTAVPGQTALAVFVLDDYTPLTQEGYRQQLARGATMQVSSALERGVDADPLSREALARRTGFDLSEYRKESGADENE